MLRFRLRAFTAVVALVIGLPLAGAAQTTPTPKAADPADPFFDDSVVHDVYLTMNTKDWQTLQIHYLENDYYTCNFQWRTTMLPDIAIRSRGTGSRNPVKPGLRVDFDRNVTDQKFLGLKSFILRNNTQDASSMHERISMQLFRRIGLPAPREAHTRLWVNKAYVGMYLIVESVDKTFLQKNFNEDNGDLYKYDYNADDKPYYLEDRGRDPALYVPHPFKPETNETHPRSEVIADWIRVINEGRSPEVFRTMIERYLGDLTKFVKHIAVEAFLGDQDGFNGNYGTNNFYLYRFENKTLLQFIAWDKSEAFKDGPEYPIYHNIYDIGVQNRNRLTSAVLGIAEMNNVYLETLLDCAKFITETVAATPGTPADTRGWMEREIEKEYAQIKDGVHSDPETPFKPEQFEAEVDRLRDFARQRADFVKGEVAKARAQ
jgi:spore coat protein CotH